MASPGRPQWSPKLAVALSLALVVALLSAARLGRRPLVAAAAPPPPLQQGQGIAAGLQEPASSAECSVNTTGSPFESRCVKFTDVCVDQGTLVLHGPEFQRVGLSPPARPPVLKGVDAGFLWPWLVGGAKLGNEVQAELRLAADADAVPDATGRSLLYQWQDAANEDRRLSPLNVRPVTPREPCPYLAHPSFSSCTVPVVWTPVWTVKLRPRIPRSAGDAFDTGAVLNSLLDASPWRQHAKLVIVTPDGLAMVPHMHTVLSALSNISVQTLADFSSRLPAQAAGPAAESRGSPAAAVAQPSFEGGEQRCFRQLFVCGNASVGAPEATEYALGQRVVQRLRAEGRVPAAAPRCGLACQLAQAESGGTGGPAAGHTANEVVLRVLFTKRSGAGRRMLNTAELLERCRGWRLAPPAAAAAVRLDCSEVEFEDVPSAVALVQQVDVLVGVHGSNLENAFFLPPGASVVEVMPLGFADDWHWGTALTRYNAQDRSSRLAWWQLVVCDPALSEPAPLEALGIPDVIGWSGKSNYPRNRSARVTLAALQAVLRMIVDARGDRERYMQAYWGRGKKQGRQGWRVFMAAGRVARGSCAAALRP